MIKFLLLILSVHRFASAGWKTYTGDNGPSQDGLSVGINQHGDDAYVGLATYRNQVAPSELIISGSHSGLYFPYGASVYLIQEGIQYYVKEPDCDYKWVSSDSGKTVPKAVTVSSRHSSPPYTFYVGRIYANNAWHVGKVTLEHRVIYYGYQMKTKSSAHYEVLTCDKVPLSTVNLMKLNPTTTTTTTTAKVPIDNTHSDEIAFLNLRITELNNKLRLAKAESLSCLDDEADLKARLMTKVQENSKMKLELDQCNANSMSKDQENSSVKSELNKCKANSFNMRNSF